MATENVADKTAKKRAEKEYAVKGNDLSGFVGVSPEYMTYASKTEKPSVRKQEPKADEPKAKEVDEEPKADEPAKPASPTQPRLP